MFVLHQLSGKAQASSNVQLHLAFIDLAKAYDSVNREALWQVLRTYGVPERLISLLQDLHSGTQAVVRLGGRVGRNFSVTSGVRQGCVVALLLFNVFLDFIVKEALRAFLDYGVDIEFWSWGQLVYSLGFEPLSFTTIVVLLYADDMVLFSAYADKLVTMLRMVDFWVVQLAMHINAAKTKIMSVGRGAHELPA